MKKLFKWIMPALLGIVQAQAMNEILTPRTSTFRSFVREVAQEEGNLNVSFAEEVNSEGVKSRVLKVDNPINGNMILGYFSPETKPQAMRSFLNEVSLGTVPVTLAEEADAEGKLTRVVIDEANQRSLLVEFKLPEVVAAIPDERVVAKTDEKSAERFEKMLKRLESFTKKARDDAQVQGKRLEGFVKDEARPKVEQEARNAGKALEKAGQKIGKVFGRKK